MTESTPRTFDPLGDYLKHARYCAYLRDDERENISHDKLPYDQERIGRHTREAEMYQARLDALNPRRHEVMATIGTGRTIDYNRRGGALAWSLFGGCLMAGAVLLLRSCS